MANVTLPSKPQFTEPVDVVVQGFREMGREEVEGAGVGLFLKVKPGDDTSASGGGFVSVEDRGMKFYRKRGHSTRDIRLFNAAMRVLNYYVVNHNNIRTFILSDPRGTGALVTEWAKNHNKPCIIIPKDKRLAHEEGIEKNLETLFEDQGNGRPRVCLVFPKNGADGFHVARDWIKKFNANSNEKIVSFVPPNKEGLSKLIKAIAQHENAQYQESRKEKALANYCVIPTADGPKDLNPDGAAKVTQRVASEAEYTQEVAKARLEESPFKSSDVNIKRKHTKTDEEIVVEVTNYVRDSNREGEITYSILTDENREKLRKARAISSKCGTYHTPQDASKRELQPTKEQWDKAMESKRLSEAVEKHKALGDNESRVPM